MNEIERSKVVVTGNKIWNKKPSCR